MDHFLKVELVEVVPIEVEPVEVELMEVDSYRGRTQNMSDGIEAERKKKGGGKRDETEE